MPSAAPSTWSRSSSGCGPGTRPITSTSPTTSSGSGRAGCAPTRTSSRARDAVTPFKCLSRADLLLRDGEVAALRDAGCETVWMGAESGAQKVLDAMEKGTRVEQIVEAAAPAAGGGHPLWLLPAVRLPGRGAPRDRGDPAARARMPARRHRHLGLVSLAGDALLRAGARRARAAAELGRLRRPVDAVPGAVLDALLPAAASRGPQGVPAVVVAPRIFALSLVPAALFSVRTAVLRGVGMMRTYAVLGVLAAAVQLGAVAFFVRTGAGIARAMSVLLAVQVVTALVAWAACAWRVGEVRALRAPGRGDVADMARTSASVGVLGLLGVLYQRLGAIAVSLFVGPAATGSFAGASRVVDAPKTGHLGCSALSTRPWPRQAQTATGGREPSPRRNPPSGELRSTRQAGSTYVRELVTRSRLRVHGVLRTTDAIRSRGRGGPASCWAASSPSAFSPSARS